MNPMVVGLTGASGIQYGIRLVQVLAEQKIPVHLILSEHARLVIREELGVTLKSLVQREAFRNLVGEAALPWIEPYSVKDMSAPAASGSFPTRGMIVIPCSMGSLAAIANGMSQHLIHRAADCALKEGRRLVLVPRETPLSAVHLENMLKLARLGVRMVPAMPGFYASAKSVQDLIDFVVGKVLDQFEIPHSLYPRWTGPLRNSEEEVPSFEKQNYDRDFIKPIQGKT